MTSPAAVLSLWHDASCRHCYAKGICSRQRELPRKTASCRRRKQRANRVHGAAKPACCCRVHRKIEEALMLLLASCCVPSLTTEEGGCGCCFFLRSGRWRKEKGHEGGG
nr:hypothetical protein Itr_chr08CG15050 [Ipomoea trifida]